MMLKIATINNFKLNFIPVYNFLKKISKFSYYFLVINYGYKIQWYYKHTTNQTLFHKNKEGLSSSLCHLFRQYILLSVFYSAESQLQYGSVIRDRHERHLLDIVLELNKLFVWNERLLSKDCIKIFEQFHCSVDPEYTPWINENCALNFWYTSDII